jgi:hypothetical protein
VLRRLSVYDGMTRLGGLTISVSARRAAVINATNAKGKRLGRFKTQKAALAAIDHANAKRATVPR